MQIPLLALVLQGIPEQIAVATLAFAIANIPLNAKKIILMGIILALFSYISRLLPITFGIHTILIISILIVLLIKIGKSNINLALIASLISFLGLIVIETICLSVLMPLFGITPEILFSNITVRILIGYPQVLFMFLAAFICYKKNKKNLENMEVK